MSASQSGLLSYRVSIQTWLLIGALFLVIYWFCREAVDYMVNMWSQSEEYSHGFLIPLISAYLIWQRTDLLRRIPFTGSWGGFGLVLLGVAVVLVGELATLFPIIQYGFLIIIYGVAWSFLGLRAFLLVVVPLLMLFFMVPLPQFLYNNISAELQLISSSIGVWVIRLFDISVFLEGNVIDLGNYKLQVVEACNGLRYLFPLMTLGFIVAYLFKAALWKRVLVFLSTVPITILMNSFRIGVIGVTVEYWGQEMADGFLHDFEGWVIFMTCFGILFIEMWVLNRISGDRRPLNSVFGIDPPEPVPEGAQRVTRTLPITLKATSGLLVAAIAALYLLPERVEDVPSRTAFSEFPSDIGPWSGTQQVMEQHYIEALDFSDYILADYRTADGGLINWYVAYYDSQRKGESAHSPRACLPGGGWRIKSLQRKVIPGIALEGQPLAVNRLLISYGDQQQLVYYWFQQRGRVVTNEYLVKFFLFWDSITKNRTDGALIRLTTPIRPGENVDVLDKRLHEFLKNVSGTLTEYVPS